MLDCCSICFCYKFIRSQSALAAPARPAENISVSLDKSKSQLFSVEEAGRLLGGISPWTLRKHISRGSVRVTRLGRRVFLGDEEVSRIMREGLPSLGNNEKSGRLAHTGESATVQFPDNGGSPGKQSQEFVVAGTPGARH